MLCSVWPRKAELVACHPMGWEPPSHLIALGPRRNAEQTEQHGHTTRSSPAKLRSVLRTPSPLILPFTCSRGRTGPVLQRLCTGLMLAAGHRSGPAALCNSAQPVTRGARGPRNQYDRFLFLVRLVCWIFSPELALGRAANGPQRGHQCATVWSGLNLEGLCKF